MQEMHTLQQSLHQHQYAEPPHDASDHVEDDDPTAVEAEAACLWAEAARRAAAGGGGGRGRGGGRGHDAGFGNFGGANRRPQFFGHAQRVPIGGAADFDVDDHSDSSDERGAGPHIHPSGYDAHGGASFGHFRNYGDNHFGGHDGYRDRGRHDHARRRDDDGLGKVKVSIPPFSGKENADAYFEWETKVDQIFDLYDYPTEKKAKLAAIEFEGYPVTWWNQIRAEYQ